MITLVRFKGIEVVMDEFDRNSKSAMMGATTMATMPNMRERMNSAIKQAEERLARTREAKEILDKNPDLERLLNIMQQGVF